MAERFRPLRLVNDHIENVWTARDLETDNEVLLKYFYSKEGPSFDTRKYNGNLEAFCLQESSKLNPARIINFISLCRNSKSQVVLAMEKPCCSLEKALLLRPKLTESETKGVIRCLLEALVACHSLNIVHRNVNPGNMFLFSDDLNSLKLGGFDMCLKDDGRSTCVGFRGSMGYMAPEQTDTTQYGTLVDIWAVGVTTYQLLYECLPYPGITAMLPMDRPELQFPVTSNISKQGIRFIQLLLSDHPIDRPTAFDALQHPWFADTAPVIRDEGAPGLGAANSYDATQTTIPTLATNHTRIHIPLQKLKSPINGATKDLSGAPAPAQKARHNSVSSVASSSATVEKSAKYEPFESNASTLSTSSNPEMNDERDDVAMNIPAGAVCIEIGKVLGQGSFGVVYAATYDRRNVAVKCLRGVYTPAACKALENEARQWLRLKHSCIVPLLGISYFDDTRVNSMGSVEAKLMLVMERMSTSVYSAIYNNYSPTVEKRLLWLRQTASAFFYLHHECQPPVLHLDLKPDNILIDCDGNARLADFGLARIQRLTNSYTTNPVQPRKHGAYLYAPPESFENRYKPTTKHDVYSFAMTAYEILGLQAPFSEEQGRAYAKDWVTRGDRPDRPSSTSIPDCCWKLIEMCWMQDATLRPDFIQIMESMENWSAEVEPPVTVEQSCSNFWDQFTANDDTLVAPSPKTPLASAKIPSAKTINGSFSGSSDCNRLKQGLTCHLDCLHSEVCIVTSYTPNHVEDESGPNEPAVTTRSQNKIPKRTFSIPKNRALQSENEAVMDVVARGPFILANNNQNSFPVVQSYAKDGQDEMSLAEGDYVVLTHVFRDGWAEGVSKREGVLAVFPLVCLGGGVLVVQDLLVGVAERLFGNWNKGK
ncbi:Receptor-interacting serine/threonine-protein kinase 2 [Chytriomyces hyalinus]|nr:Receptor-interacting serine/threonine-protein kinase 2 [Chytriomyces hyalinus]